MWGSQTTYWFHHIILVGYCTIAHWRNMTDVRVFCNNTVRLGMVFMFRLKWPRWRLPSISFLRCWERWAFWRQRYTEAAKSVELKFGWRMLLTILFLHLLRTDTQIHIMIQCYSVSSIIEDIASIWYTEMSTCTSSLARPPRPPWMYQLWRCLLSVIGTGLEKL